MENKQVLLAYNPSHVHHTGKMNECAARVEAVVDELKAKGLWSRCELVGVPPPTTTTTTTTTTPVTMTEITATALHTAKHLAALRTGFRLANMWNCNQCTFSNEMSAESCNICGAFAKSDFIIPEGKSDVYLCDKSYQVALENCSLCTEAATRLLSREDEDLPPVVGGFALVRPPGHHAYSEHFGSYCLINTVAVVCKMLLARKDGPKRILIVDWDVHHGDGTQALVEGDSCLSNQVMFVSIHRHDKEFWPKSGAVDEGGKAVVNIPLTGIGYGDADYMYVFLQVVLPLAKRFEPDLVLVSAGYDCADGDQLGRFSVTTAGFGWMTRQLLGIAPCLFVLEGGYDVDGSGACPHKPLRTGVAATVESLLDAAEGREAPPVSSMWCEEVRDLTKQVVDQVLERQGTFL
jgi:acetoin utilization deacetylase AcuC-like enzyme